ncbi:hypothetical protein [Catellatospora tritici]|uniref:hypothetical protein n=1 Tax=Catellatospora tritici TaxID=2851566 RepID=UPI001C2D26EC|nr:hypothetical protein [Catellatospora tritici]MBV1849831.1 hypothetical protein [Catellatospora tritici]
MRVNKLGRWVLSGMLVCAVLSLGDSATESDQDFTWGAQDFTWGRMIADSDATTSPDAVVVDPAATDLVIPAGMNTEKDFTWG